MKDNKNITIDNTNKDNARETPIEEAPILNVVNPSSPSNTMFNNIIFNEEQIQNLINSLSNANLSSLNGNKDLFSDINNQLKSLNKLISGNSSSGTTTTETPILESLLAQITTINSLKTQINELPFSPFERIYVENCITPLLTIFYQMAIAAASFKDTAQSLSLSTTTRRKTHKIKKYEKTTYEIMDQTNCLYSILQDRIYDFLEIICRKK